jgi:hypothetical protein
MAQNTSPRTEPSVTPSAQHTIIPPMLVVITYRIDPKTGAAVIVEPPVAKLKLTGTIRFKRDGIMDGRLRLTFSDKTSFKTGNLDFAANGVVNEEDGDVTVIAVPSRRQTTYACDLIDAKGNVIAKSQAGGAIEVVMG